MDQQRQFHLIDTAHRAEKVKTPATLLGSSVHTLLPLSNVTTIAELSPVWWELAPANKTQQRNVLQQAVDVAMLEEVSLASFEHMLLRRHLPTKF
jgi:hypothetical protein